MQAVTEGVSCTNSPSLLRRQPPQRWGLWAKRRTLPNGDWLPLEERCPPAGGKWRSQKGEQMSPQVTDEVESFPSDVAGRYVFTSSASLRSAPSPQGEGFGKEANLAVAILALPLKDSPRPGRDVAPATERGTEVDLRSKDGEGEPVCR